MAKVLKAINQSETAQQRFKHAVAIDPTNHVAHYGLATLYRKAGEVQEAKEKV
jgi:Tfp pilus assembly protein PilF